jgi:hypothetical protein
MDQDIDMIDEKLNLFMTKDAAARRNWRKIKFRLQVISQFVSIESWRK